MAQSTLVHATTVCLGEAGVLIRGAPGSGKSTLGLALLDDWRAAGAFAALVSDDQTELRVAAGAVIACPPAPIAGLVERRGVGILALRALWAVRVRLVVDLAGDPPRLPCNSSALLCGVALPALALVAGRPLDAALSLRHVVDRAGRVTLPSPSPGPLGPTEARD